MANGTITIYVKNVTGFPHNWALRDLTANADLPDIRLGDQEVSAGLIIESDDAFEEGNGKVSYKIADENYNAVWVESDWISDQETVELT